MRADVHALTSPNRQLRTEEIEIEGVGSILVSGLNRLDALRVQNEKDPFVADRLMLVGGVIDPQITEETAKAWQRRADAGEIERITRRIFALSGMEDLAPKEAYKSVRDESDA